MSLDTEGVTCPWEKAGQEQFLYRTVKCRDDGAAAGLPAVPSSEGIGAYMGAEPE